MAEIMNNTVRPVTFHHNRGKFEVKIYPRDSEEVPDNLWKIFKKNSRIKDMLEKQEIIVIEEAPGLLTKIKKFFY